jgi:hypothetical protein
MAQCDLRIKLEEHQRDCRWCEHFWNTNTEAVLKEVPQCEYHQQHKAKAAGR